MPKNLLVINNNFKKKKAGLIEVVRKKFPFQFTILAPGDGILIPVTVTHLGPGHSKPPSVPSDTDYLRKILFCLITRKPIDNNNLNNNNNNNNNNNLNNNSNLNPLLIQNDFQFHPYLCAQLQHGREHSNVDRTIEKWALFRMEEHIPNDDNEDDSQIIFVDPISRSEAYQYCKAAFPDYFSSSSSSSSSTVATVAPPAHFKQLQICNFHIITCDQDATMQIPHFDCLDFIE